MLVIRPPATRMLAGSIPSGVRTRRLLSTSSAGGMAWEVISCQLSVISWRDNANLELARISRRAHHRLRQREAPRGRPRRVDRRDSDRSVTARQPRPPPGARLATHLDDLQLRGALDQHGALHTDLLHGVGADDGGDELVAGALHDPPREHDRARPHPPELPSGNALRHSISRVRSRRLRNARV